MDSPGTWEILCSTNLGQPTVPGYKRDQALRQSRPHGSERGDEGLEQGSESISDPVFGTGGRSALIVLTTPGNAARADPVEGSGAPLLQNRS
jgi:DNA-binding IclR family transcriptional regulator